MQKRDNSKHIEERILRLFAKKKQALGWYLVEHFLTIPPEDFPSGTNVMTFLEALNSHGLIEETTNSKGKVAYILTSLGWDKIAKLEEQSKLES